LLANRQRPQWSRRVIFFARSARAKFGVFTGMIRGVLHIISLLVTAAHSLTSGRERKPLLPRFALPGRIHHVD
jgi:hypothetical protein